MIFFKDSTKIKKKRQNSRNPSNTAGSVATHRLRGNLTDFKKFRGKVDDFIVGR
jgi:hypothetical protein